MFRALVLTATLLAVCSSAYAAPKAPLNDKQLVTLSQQLFNNRDAYTDKVYGAWYGKLIGLILGQPTEGWPKQQIEDKASKINAYPITYYLPKGFETHLPNFLLENLDGSPSNDDSNLMLVSLLALREYGIDLTAKNIAQSWVKYVGGACTAEGIALDNFCKGIWPPASATFRNPYSEWIGAQMRGDIWGMIAPGMPKIAARYAYLDASISHARNGVYAEQFISATVSAAMVETDPEKIIRTALKTIPHNCTYAAAIRDILQWHSDNKDWQDTYKLMDKKWGLFADGKGAREFKDSRYNTKKGFYQWGDWKWVHADINGAACALALLYGEGDFSKSICIATMCGYDNDCNAGTVGAIVGAMTGEKAIPERWKTPIHDIYHSGLRMKDRKLKISELAKETVDYGLQVRENLGARN